MLPEAAQDQVELNSLLMVQNKQTWLNRTNTLFKQGLTAMAAGLAPAAPAATDTSTSPATGTEDLGSIQNRSPTTTTTNNCYPPAAPVPANPWPAIAAMVILAMAMLLAAGFGMWYIARTQPATTPPVAGQLPAPGTPAKPAQDYIEFYRP